MMEKIVFEDTVVEKKPYIEINGQEYEVNDGTYIGGTELNKDTFNQMQNNIEAAIEKVQNDVDLLSDKNNIQDLLKNILDSVLDSTHPVGSIYLSEYDINPSNLFGGTWEQIDGYYLYAGVGGEISGSNISGEASGNTGSTVLTVDQIPPHSHTGRIKPTDGHYDGGNNEVRRQDDWSSGIYTATITDNTGGGQGHTHTLNNHTHSVEPLRYELYAWKRTE